MLKHGAALLALTNPGDNPELDEIRKRTTTIMCLSAKNFKNRVHIFRAKMA